MAWLAEWLRQIIAIILLAGIIELLLPSNAYQRYVRLVIGLFILLALLSPILSLLQGEFGSRLEQGIRSWQGLDSAMLAGDADSLAAVNRQAELLREQQQEQAAGLAATKVAEEMKQEISRRSGAPVTRVDVILAADSRAGYWRIESVAVALSGNPSREETPSDIAVRQPPPVEPVAVEVWLGGEASPPAAPTGGEAGAQWQQTVRLILEEGWGVSGESVIVRQADSE
ncbi:stage III sporulation protein AF [Paenibacillus sp. 1P07SE]|uniref:stage III sporulation protein AF n=1 Tax=Paenibacillus sp. 1P07SE TaxID=3132209 RepID=UPI0039A69F84